MGCLSLQLGAQRFEGSIRGRRPEDLILEGDESKVPQWREAANRAHRMGLWDDPRDTRYSRNRVVV